MNKFIATISIFLVIYSHAAAETIYSINNGKIIINDDEGEVECAIKGELLYAVLSSDKSALIVSGRGYVPISALEQCKLGATISSLMIPVNNGALSDINVDHGIYVALDLIAVRPARYLAIVSNVGSSKNLISLDGSYIRGMSMRQLRGKGFIAVDIPGTARISKDGRFVAASGEIDCGNEAYPGVWDVKANKKILIPLTKEYGAEMIRQEKCAAMFEGRE